MIDRQMETIKIYLNDMIKKHFLIEDCACIKIIRSFDAYGDGNLIEIYVDPNYLLKEDQKEFEDFVLTLFENLKKDFQEENAKVYVIKKTNGYIKYKTEEEKRIIRTKLSVKYLEIHKEKTKEMYEYDMAKHFYNFFSKEIEQPYLIITDKLPSYYKVPSFEELEPKIRNAFIKSIKQFMEEVIGRKFDGKDFL